MTRRCAIEAITVGGAVSFVSRLLQAAESPSDYTIRSDVRLVLLDVSVTDARGSLVAGLPKDSFQVMENGRSQPITVFDNADIPVTVGLLVDESRSMGPKRPDVLAAADVFIKESNPRDEMFVLNFNDQVQRGLPEKELFSDNPRELSAALYRGRAAGKTALNDAIVDGLALLEQGRREKKTLVLISDGGDNASKHTRPEMLEKVEASIATIYTIGLFDEDDPDRNPGLLRRLAAVSGGQAYFPPDTTGMIPICRNIAREIRSRYTIGYVPKPENGTGLRHVQVRVWAAGHKSLHARTRSSYRY
ncbi:MAG TPA: VWA domain-containing protein [Bryobacteraceae bacterium]|nr:VWA domain-containing protein [Bryobacteraceae bacterium]